MATTTVSIGSRSDTVDTETPATSSGSGPLYVVTFGTTPTGIAVGHMGFMDTEGSDEDYESASDYEFVVTAISGANITLKYLRDSGSTDHSPLGLYDGSGSSGSPVQAPMVFKRHGLPTAHNTSGAPSYVITFNDAGPPADLDVGDIAFVDDDNSSSEYEYVVTAIDLSAKTVTMKYVTDSSGSGDASPYGMVNSATTQAVIQFKRAFSTITLFEGMIDDASPNYWGGSDDVVGECHGDAAFTDPRVQFNNKESLASVKLTVHETDRHDGKAGTAGKVVIRPTAYAGSSAGVIEPNIDNFIMEWIEIDLSSTNTTKGVYCKGTNDDNVIRNNIIHSRTGNPTSDPIFAIHMAGASSASSDTISILNNIVYDFRETGDDGAAGININGWKGILNIYNNTVHNIESDDSGSRKTATCFRFNGQATQVANVKNNIASLMIADTAAEYRAYWDTGTGTSNVDYNLSDDTTNATYEAQGANSLKDKTAAQIDFVSVSIGTEDYHLDTDSVCREAGVDLGTTNGVNIDIDGVDRDATGVTWDMGADQASTKDTGNPAFLMFVD